MIALGEVTELIQRKLRNRLPDGLELNGDTRLDQLGLSSLQISDIVFTIEDRHGFEFDPARAAGIQTVGDILALANEMLADAAKTTLG
ncbi:acyl carrier protein [Spirillospora sp. NPDC047279]|uniref:acyl carrier protein n=1 Tax=Spirillospora sp. NPDC047279 TaxID=3155478 RepID=UPI0033F1455A